MKVDDSLYCPIHSITHTFKTIHGDAIVFELTEKDGMAYLRYHLSKEDADDIPEFNLRKFRFDCVGLSVATFGHFWVEDKIMDQEFNTIWTSEKILYLVVNKEILPKGKREITPRDILFGEDLATWIANNYPRVFTYYTTSLFLLRTSIPTEYLYADILLNYYKIIELVTYKRTNKKPDLDVILEDSKNLNIISVDENDIKQFYIIRCRDAAHDWDKVQEISRRQAVECKMWVDELIIKDMIKRGGKPDHLVGVKESPTGAILISLNQEGATKDEENRVRPL